MSRYETCDDNRFEIIKELKEYIIEATNIETSPDEMKVLDDICFRLWQLGLTLETKRNLKKLEKENQELKDKLSQFEKPILYMCRARASKDFERMRLIELSTMLNVPIILEDAETLGENKKLTKAIEIIKNKAVNVAKLLISFNTDNGLDYYNYALILFRLTQQEYELLKEVLGNEYNI